MDRIGRKLVPPGKRLLAVAVVPVAAALAQSQAPTRIAFEVASIRPHQGDVLMLGGSLSGPRIRLVAMSLTDLVAVAYHRENYQISGPQHWMAADRYDILANVPREIVPSEDNVRLMFQALLADRFQLKVHMETKERPVYALVAGKNGPKLKASTADQYSQSAGGNRTALETFAKASMEQFAKHLSYAVERPVLDKTGLQGFYDFTLSWTPDNGGPPPPDSNGVDIFKALQEQLGLKLEPQKAPIEILLIDHAEKPSAN